jgi:hypothetical protein
MRLVLCLLGVLFVSEISFAGNKDVIKDCRLEIAASLDKDSMVLDKPEVDEEDGSTMLTFEKNKNEFGKLIFFKEGTVKGIIQVSERENVENKMIFAKLDSKDPNLSIMFGESTETWTLLCSKK